MSDKDLFESAVTALHAGEVSRLRDLLQQHPDLAQATDAGNATLLIRLIDWPGRWPNSGESVRALVDAGADVDARRDSSNGTPLSGALCNEDSDVIRELLAAGADVNLPCGWREGTVLEQATFLCDSFDRADEPPLSTIRELFSSLLDRPFPGRTAVGNPVPLLFVRDFTGALNYYRSRLGFTVLWQYGTQESSDDPYCSIKRGNTEFHLTVCHCEDERHIGNLDVRLETRDCDALYEEFCAAGAGDDVEPPQDKPWGLREFGLQDPDGNRLTFFQH